MKIHVKPSKTHVVINLSAFAFILTMEIWFISVAHSTSDFLYALLFLLFLNILPFHMLSCSLRSYTLDTDGIYVKWHICNKTKFHSWLSFKDNYCMRTNVNGEYLDVVVFSKKKLRFREPPVRIINDGFYPSSAVCIVICDDAHFSSKKHTHCVCKSQFMELLQKCNVSVDWNA